MAFMGGNKSSRIHPDHWRDYISLALGGLGLGGFCLFIARLPGLPCDAPLYVLAHLTACGALWLAARPVLRGRLSERPTWAVILTLSVAFRALVISDSPLFDDDIYRYRWDGTLLAHGINPYRYPPDAGELAPWRDHFYAQIGFPYVRTVYPPLSQAAFALGYALSPKGLLGLKLVVVAADLVAIFACGAVARALGQSAGVAILYAWHPLVLKEFAQTGHHDALAIALLTVLVWAAIRHHRSIAALCLAGATLIKLFPVMLAPLLVRRLGVRRLALAAVIVVVAYAPFLGAGHAVVEGLATYARYWEFNDSLYPLIRGACGLIAENADPGARSLVALILLGGIAWLLVHPVPRCWPLHRRMFALLAAFFLVAPTADPWYFCWLLPFLCWERRPSWFLLSATVGASYLFYWQGRDLWWLRPAEYIPFFALFFWEVWRSFRRSGRT